MGSYAGTPEIVEVKEETNPVRRYRSYSTLGSRGALDDEINKLFESISRRSSARGSASSSHDSITGKNPLFSSVPQSPRISAEPVSIKQALRDLCISKASEMAVMKRSSMQCSSPGSSEAGRIKTLYDMVVLDEEDKPEEPAKEGKRSGKNAALQERIIRITSLSKSSDLSSQSPPKNLSTQSSPGCDNHGSRYRRGNSSLRSFAPPRPHNPVDSPNISKNQPPQPLIHCSPSSPPHADSGGEKIVAELSNGEKIYPKIAVIVSESSIEKKTKRRADVSAKASTAKPKGRQPKPVMFVHVNRPARLKKNLRIVKPIRKPSPRKKKSKQIMASNAAKSKDVAASKCQLVCKNCQCALKNANEVDSQESLTISDGVETNSSNDYSDSGKEKPTSVGYATSRTVAKSKNSKSKDKGELSLSSKSSLGEFSTSTSNSEESSISRPSCGNKPHMSKDIRWEVIRRVKLRDGFLSLKHFNLLKKLGCGDIGTVYLAELINSNCLFAIKVMDNEFLARRKKMSRAHTEREILRTLDHPFLPTLYTQFTSDNLSCLVMEYCPGGDLHVLRQKQPGRCFPEPAARFYVAEVLLALEYLHMLGIIYRDLKPENILVREDGHIMLTDFDLSLTCNVNPTLMESSNGGEADPRRISGPCAESNCIDPFCIKPASCFTPRAHSRRAKLEGTNAKPLLQLVAEPTDARSNSFVGTHEYLAPEIIKGEGHGAAVDWWTFGIFLYELLYGRTPFKGCGNEETLANVVLESLSFPDAPLVSFHARDLMRKLLVKEPENRLGSEKGAAEIKLHPFFEGLNWALIRCAVPPETPDFYSVVNPGAVPQGKNAKLMECKTTGEHLEFELF